jgi:hypothetical protein
VVYAVFVDQLLSEVGMQRYALVFRLTLLILVGPGSAMFPLTWALTVILTPVRASWTCSLRRIVRWRWENGGWEWQPGALSRFQFTLRPEGRSRRTLVMAFGACRIVSNVYSVNCVLGGLQCLVVKTGRANVMGDILVLFTR